MNSRDITLAKKDAVLVSGSKVSVPYHLSQTEFYAITKKSTFLMPCLQSNILNFGL